MHLNKKRKKMLRIVRWSIVCPPRYYIEHNTQQQRRLIISIEGAHSDLWSTKLDGSTIGELFFFCPLGIERCRLLERDIGVYRHGHTKGALYFRYAVIYIYIYLKQICVVKHA